MPRATPTPDSARAQAHHEMSRQMLAQAVRGVTDRLRQGPATIATLARDLGLTVARVRSALADMRQAGTVAEVDGSVSAALTYRLIDPRLPERSAALTTDAERVHSALLGRAETELGLMAATGLDRDRVREGLARLWACGRLGWRGVGHLIVYRLETQAEAEAVA